MLHYFPSVPRDHLPDNDCVKVARNSLDRATMANEDGPFSCFGCNGILVYRKSHKRSRYSMHKTTLFHVRGYFAHVQRTTANHCSGESRAHSTAKALLLDHPFHPLLFHCAQCDTRKPFDILTPSEDGDASTRYVAEYTITEIGRRVDVAIIRDSNLVGVIEVCHTHACDDHKLHDLTNLVGDRWCEVLANDVVDCIAVGAPIPVATCSGRVCTVCHDNTVKSVQRTQTHLLQERICNSQSVRMDVACASQGQKDDTRPECVTLMNGRLPPYNQSETAFTSSMRCIREHAVRALRKEMQHNQQVTWQWLITRPRSQKTQCNVQSEYTKQQIGVS